MDNIKMNYKELILNAIEKEEVAKLLRGEEKYELNISKFTSDVFPTDINSVLVNCFYKQKKDIQDIDVIFTKALYELIDGNACDIYIALLYFDACIFQEERGKAEFLIDKEEISQRLQVNICKEETRLRDSVQFSNGMKKINPWNNIMNFGNYYKKKYGIRIM